MLAPAVYSTAALVSGTHSMTAIYSGDSAAQREGRSTVEPSRSCRLPVVATPRWEPSKPWR